MYQLTSEDIKHQLIIIFSVWFVWTGSQIAMPAFDYGFTWLPRIRSVRVGLYTCTMLTGGVAAVTKPVSNITSLLPCLTILKFVRCSFIEVSCHWQANARRQNSLRGGGGGGGGGGGRKEEEGRRRMSVATVNRSTGRNKITLRC